MYTLRKFPFKTKEMSSKINFFTLPLDNIILLLNICHFTILRFNINISGKKMSKIYSEFESIGDNYEFAFFLRDSGCDDGSIFRWTLIKDYESFLRLITTNFKDIYKYENLTPSWEDMVLDKSCGICFHTEMYSDNISGCWRWRFPENKNRDIHKKELEKINYLVEKFKKGLSSGNKTYVLKNNSNNLDDLALKIAQYFKEQGNCSLLYVKKCDETSNTGRIHQLTDNLYEGYIDRFAEYSRANDFSRFGWELLLNNYQQIKKFGSA